MIRVRVCVRFRVGVRAAQAHVVLEEVEQHLELREEQHAVAAWHQVSPSPSPSPSPNPDPNPYPNGYGFIRYKEKLTQPLTLALTLTLAHTPTHTLTLALIPNPNQAREWRRVAAPLGLASCGPCEQTLQGEAHRGQGAP